MRLPDATSRAWRLAILQSDLPRSRKFVALVIETYMQDDRRGQVNGWPEDGHHLSAAAELAGVSEGTFLGHYVALREGGWL